MHRANPLASGSYICSNTRVMRLLSHNRKLVLIVLLFVVFIALPLMAQNQFRFPRPDFKSDYQIPEATQPEAGGTILLYSSVILLVLCTALASWLALRARSRSGILALCIFSIVFFGFVRKGCVCPVGSLQNVSLALFSPYAIPITAAIFFVIPLLFTLVFGRTFCAAVCPLGAVQDVVIVKPLSLPRWLRHVLSILPCIYLALAVLLAATGTDFIICRFDPFVGFFRIGAELHMIFAGAMFLASPEFWRRPGVIRVVASVAIAGCATALPGLIWLDTGFDAVNAQIVRVEHNGEYATTTKVETHFDRFSVVSELGLKPSDLLQANGIIWVKGPSDRVYLNR